MKKTMLVLTVIASLTLAACSTSGPADQPAPAPAPAQETQAPAQAETPAQAEAPAKAEAPADKKLTVAFSQMEMNNAWRAAETASMKEEAEKRGVEFIYTDANGDTAKQVSDVEDIISKNPDYICIAPREFEGLAPALAAAKAAGIPVLLLDRDAKGEPGVDYKTLICADFIWEGKTCAEELVKKFGPDAEVNIVQVTGTPGSSVAIDRQKGFEDEIAKYPGYKIISTQNGEFTRSIAQKVMENVIQSHGDEIMAVYGHDDECALGAVQALKAAGYKPGEDVTVVGIGGFLDAAVSIEAGEMLGTVLCSPFFGPTTFDTIEKLDKNESVPTFIQNPGYFVDKSNVAEYKPNAF